MDLIFAGNVVLRKFGFDKGEFMKTNYIYAIGLMSGTSSDGLSIAYCKISFQKRIISVIAHKTYPYSHVLQEKIMKARDLGVREIACLNYDMGKIWASMIERFIREFKIKRIDVISSHGQTIYHSSKDKVTYQIGEVEFITRRFKIPVAYDFRTGDIVSDGQGAPLISFLDEFLFGDFPKPVVLLNVGGIANLTICGGGVKVFGFDVGPGNSLMDWAVRIYSGGRLRYDKDGKLASKGIVDFDKIERFLKNPFFFKKPPKSLDREEFGERFVIENFDFKKEKIEDILATLNFFTAICIRIAIDRFTIPKPTSVIVSGGGVFNKKLMENLFIVLNGIELKSISDYGIHPLAKEAAGFALLGAARLLNIPSNCPSVTGAKEKIVLGKLSFP